MLQMAVQKCGMNLLKHPFDPFFSDPSSRKRLCLVSVITSSSSSFNCTLG